MASSATPTILVVEDDDIVRMLMVDVLEELDFTVLEAADWDSALAMFSPDAVIDLMITDHHLRDTGGRTGLDLAAQVQGLRPGLPILIASGDGGSLSAPEGIQLLSKPFTIDTLRNTVNGLLA